MKYFLFLFLIALLPYSAFSQDSLFFHNGNIGIGKVLEKNDNSFKFIYAGEDFSNVIGFNSVSHVKYESGREEQITPKISVASVSDWSNVKVVYTKEDVLGLKSLGQVEKHSSGTWSFSVSEGHFAEKTLKKIRQEAARRGGCFVLVLTSQGQSTGLLNIGNASITGEIFTY